MATDEYGNEINEGTDDIPGLRKYVKDLEKKFNEAQAKASQYEQKEAIRSAGLTDLNDAQYKALMATHEGESTPEAWRQTAESLNFVQPVPPVDPAVQQGHERIANAAASGQTQAPKPGIDALEKATTPEEVIRIAQANGVPTTWDAF